MIKAWAREEGERCKSDTGRAGGLRNGTYKNKKQVESGEMVTTESGERPRPEERNQGRLSVFECRTYLRRGSFAA